MKTIVRLSIVGTLLAVAYQVVAQTPSPCANTCLKTYRAAVAACKGDTSCIAAARAAARACIKTCAL